MDDTSLERLEVQTAYHEYIEGEEEFFTKEQNDILNQLTPVEREMLLERLYDGMLIRDIAKARGMRSHEAKRIIHEALSKCRRYAERLGIGSTGLSFEQEMEKLSEYRGRN